jgi:hypothetical protein
MIAPLSGGLDPELVGRLRLAASGDCESGEKTPVRGEVGSENP